MWMESEKRVTQSEIELENLKKFTDNLLADFKETLAAMIKYVELWKGLKDIMKKRASAYFTSEDMTEEDVLKLMETVENNGS